MEMTFVSKWATTLPAWTTMQPQCKWKQTSPTNGQQVGKFYFGLPQTTPALFAHRITSGHVKKSHPTLEALHSPNDDPTLQPPYSICISAGFAPSQLFTIFFQRTSVSPCCMQACWWCYANGRELLDGTGGVIVVWVIVILPVPSHWWEF